MQTNQKQQKKAFKFLGIFMVAALLVGMSSCQQHSDEEYAALESKSNELQATLTGRDSVINDMMETFNLIESNLEEVKKQRQIVSLESSDKVEMTEDRKTQIIADVQAMNQLLAESRDKINSLNSKLEKSGLKISGLEKKMAQLEQTLIERNNDIEMLRSELVKKDFEIGQITQQVNNLETEVTEQKSVIDQKQQQLNTAYYVTGTYQELRDKGIINKEGGFLGMGTNKSLNSSVSQESFSKIDITTFTKLNLNVTKATLITEHPVGSYQLVKENDKIVYLEISNPNEFWKVSKYAVIQVK